MRIEHASVQLESDHAAAASSTASNSARLTVTPPATAVSGPQVTKQAAVAPAPDLSNLGSLSAEQRTMLLVVERLFGGHVHLVHPSDLQGTSGAAARASTAQPAAQAQPAISVTAQARATYDEAEVMDFTAQADVSTTDGKQIHLDLGVTMQRAYHQDQQLSLQSGNAKPQDPLVINTPGSAPQLTGGTFSFDLQDSGATEQLPMLGAGSGYLALDSNGNGVIDSGGELFGTQSGNGFSDLAALDQNHDGWIDEQDQAYSRLRVWRPDTTGQGSLTGLHDAGVGAIYLGSSTTPFELKDPQNNTKAEVRRTGIYLSDDGAAGTVMQVDLFA